MIGIAICYTGPLEEGEKAIKPLRDFGSPAIDLVGPLPYTALQGMFDLFYPHGICSYWKTEHLNELSDDAAEETLAHFAEKTSPLSQFFIEHLGGALTRASEDEMAFSHRDARYRIFVVTLWTDPAEGETHIDWARDWWQAIKPYSTGDVYLNYLGEEGEDRVRAAYGPGKYERLATLKAKYDPTNFFRLNQNIAPAREMAYAARSAAS